MVDSISPKDWIRLDDLRTEQGLYSQSQIEDYLTFWDTGTHKVKWGTTRSGKQRYKTVRPKGLSSATRRLAGELNKPNIIETDIDLATSAKELPTFSEVDRVRTPTDKLFKLLSTKAVELREVEIVEVEREAVIIEEKAEEKRLVSKGKIEQLFRSRLINASSESEIDSILSDARGNVSDKGLDRLEENAADRLENFDRERI